MNSVTSNYSITGTVIRTTLIFLLIFSFASSPVESKLLAAAASTHSVTLNWTAPGDDGNQGQASQYDIRYATFLINDSNWDQADQPPNIPSPQVAGSAESITIDGLNSSTTYYFAIRVADEVPNWSPTSNVATVSTAAESDAPSDVANLLTSHPTNSSLDLSWTAPGDDSTSGTASQYDIRYSTSVINAANFDQATAVSGEPTPSPAGSSESMTVSGLDPNTDYYFAIKTADEVPNWSGISNIATGSTINEQIAPGDISNLLASDATDTSVTLTWTAPGDDGNSGTADQYDIRYSTFSINGTNFDQAAVVSGVPAPSLAGSSESIEVIGLNPSTTYYFAIKTADEIPNWSGLSNISNLTTLVEQQPPANIADLSSPNATDSTITISWTAPGDDGAAGTATVYDIRYSSTIINVQNWDSAVQITDEPTPLLAGTTQSYTLEGLSQGVGYFFAIKTADEVPNWSGLSNILAVATAGDNTPPAAINDLGASTGSSEGTIDLSWTAPGDDG
ncbi:MAG: fibronectin type III domain-containing protein, partial [bacterium]|nr:fibronectin type III domain-containing protein [bacterium]